MPNVIVALALPVYNPVVSKKLTDSILLNLEANCMHKS